MLVTDVLGQPIGPIFKGQAVHPRISSWIDWPLKIGPEVCPETSATNSQITLRKTPEDRRSHLHRRLNREFLQPIPILQPFVKNSYTDFHAKPTNRLVADARQTDSGEKEGGKWF